METIQENNRCAVPDERERRRMVIEEITAQVKKLLCCSDADGLQWCGTKTDLLELLYEVYVSGRILQRDGQIASFTYLVREVFRVLHVKELRNPRACVCRARNKKGMRSLQFMDRINMVMFGDGDMCICDFWQMMICGVTELRKHGITETRNYGKTEMRKFLGA